MANRVILAVAVRLVEQMHLAVEHDRARRALGEWAAAPDEMPPNRRLRRARAEAELALATGDLDAAGEAVAIAVDAAAQSDYEEVTGPVIARLGTKRVLIVGGILSVASLPLVGVATSPAMLVAGLVGLLFFDVPFGFVALLGAMSLAGMMLKNGIVLLDEINLNLSLGKAPYDAVMDSAASRLRPVALAAATTVLGVIPLLQDAFWIGLSVVIMVGLTFGTLLTMVLLPTLYCTLYRISSPGKGERSVQAPSGTMQQPQTS